MLKFPSFKLFRIQHEIHPFTSTQISTSSTNAALPNELHRVLFHRFQSTVFFAPLLDPLSTCKAPMGISPSSSPVTPENVAGLRRWEFNNVLPSHPDEQATWKHYRTSINIAMDIIIQYSASLAHSLEIRVQCVKVATRAYCRSQ